MGCAISGHKSVMNSNLLHLNDNSSIELISSSLQLINYFKDKDNNLPKCIFIFGGSGSNKGEFIYEMICSSWVNYGNEQMNECQQQKLIKEKADLDYLELKNISNNDPKQKTIDLFQQMRNNHNHNQMNENQNLKSEEFSPHITVNNQTQSSAAINFTDSQKNPVNENTNHHFWNSNAQLSNRSSFSNISIKYQDNLNFVYSYIDIEKLILDNLRERVKNVGECGMVGYDELFTSNTSLNMNISEMDFNQKNRKTNKLIIKCDSNNNKKESNDKSSEELSENVENKVHVNGEKIDDIEMVDSINFKQTDCIKHYKKKIFDWNLEENNQKKNSYEAQEIKEEKITDQPMKSICEQEKEKNQEKIHHHDEAISSKTDSQKNHMSSSIKNHLRHNKQIKNNNWTEFLKACEEEFNQSIIDTKYKNSRNLRQCMFTYANCITNNWVFSLIEKEIEKRNQNLRDRFVKLVENHHTRSNKEFVADDEEKFEKQFDSIKPPDNKKYVLPEIIYIINLIPNQINIFRHCLFLQQTPNLVNFNVNFIAINLISGDLRKKDIDSVMGHTIQDEFYFNYMNYFRSIDRLTDVQIRQLKQKIRIRINNSKQAIKMKNESDVRMLLGALENNQQINLSDFNDQNERKKNIENKESKNKFEDQNKKGNLLYIIDNVVDIGDVLFCIEDQTLKMSTLRKFIQVYLKQKDNFCLNRFYS